MTPAQRLLHELLNEPPKPAWAIRDTRGNFYGTLPRGEAATADEAVQAYKAKFGARCPYKVEHLRAFPR